MTQIIPKLEATTVILIVASTKDTASVNISQKLISLYDFEKTQEGFQQNPIYSKMLSGNEVKLVYLNEETIWAQYITDNFSPELIIFVSRHSGTAGIPTLSVHAPGNLGSAELGGIPKRVSVCPASAMKNALLELARIRTEKSLPYQVSYECTHHGPSLDAPTMFVELGSSPEQWEDLQAAEAVAHAAMAAITQKIKYPVVLGVGGPHYSERFTKIALTTNRAFGHIMSKYVVPSVDAETVKHCVQRTLEKVESAVLDWKSMRATDRKRVVDELEQLGVLVERA
jgi:D-aminoacyl-tRNA deacylase